jgi:ABC-type Fe3+-hydroxamate transport system substrate-binding protein
VTRAGAANAAVLMVSLVAAAWGGLERGADRPNAVVPSREMAVTAVRRVPVPGGGEGIVDASGHVVPLRPYRRIISTNLMSDRLLAELAEPERIAAFSATSGRQSPWRWRFSGKPGIDGFGRLEPIIALRPDLVLMNVFGSDGRIGRLLEAGIEVFNLGELHGLRTFLPMAEVIGELLGDPERGRRLARTFRERMKRVAAPLGARPRRRAIYLWAMGGNLYGGTRDTNFGDVLTHAGLIDVAAERYSGWPEYRPEQVVAMEPEVVVTQDGLADVVCGHPGLAGLPACRTPGRVLTLPAGLLEEPGAAMLDAAELLFAKAYPDLAR